MCRGAPGQRTRPRGTRGTRRAPGEEEVAQEHVGEGSGHGQRRELSGQRLRAAGPVRGRDVAEREARERRRERQKLGELKLAESDRGHIFLELLSRRFPKRARSATRSTDETGGSSHRGTT